MQAHRRMPPDTVQRSGLFSTTAEKDHQPSTCAHGLIFAVLVLFSSWHVETIARCNITSHKKEEPKVKETKKETIIPLKV